MHLKQRFPLFNKTETVEGGMTKEQDRDSEGRYQHRLDRICVCGHTLGTHVAARIRCEGQMVQECLAPECECECFSKPRKG